MPIGSAHGLGRLTASCYTIQLCNVPTGSRQLQAPTKRVEKIFDWLFPPPIYQVFYLLSVAPDVIVCQTPAALCTLRHVRETAFRQSPVQLFAAGQISPSPGIPQFNERFTTENRSQWISTYRQQVSVLRIFCRLLRYRIQPHKNVTFGHVGIALCMSRSR